jgi:hypothetical protein
MEAVSFLVFAEEGRESIFSRILNNKNLISYMNDSKRVDSF